MHVIYSNNLTVLVAALSEHIFLPLYLCQLLSAIFKKCRAALSCKICPGQQEHYTVLWCPLEKQISLHQAAVSSAPSLTTPSIKIVKNFLAKVGNTLLAQTGPS